MEIQSLHNEGRPSAAPHHMVAGAFGARHHVVMHYVITYWISIKNMKYFPSRSEATPFPERSDSSRGGPVGRKPPREKKFTPKKFTPFFGP